MDNGIYLIEMGKKIKDARQERGINLRDLGKLCKLDFGTLSRIENGKFNSKVLTLKLIADILEVDVKDFL